MKFRSILSLVPAALLLTNVGGAEAATATQTFNVTMAIQTQCQVANATNMVFPAAGSLAAIVNQTSTFNVTCPLSTPYTVGLDDGGNVVGAQRRMKGGIANNEFINYNLFQDVARTVAWGNVSGSWQTGTGTGVVQTYTVYGQVPVQATPSPATNYTDTVTITVTF